MRARRSLVPIALLLGALGTPPAHAQSTADRIRSATRALEFRNIGPTIMGGRISDIAPVDSDPRIFYVGTATGGVWKTENAGITFSPVFDGEETSSIGDVTVSPSNPNVVWVGTGEPQNRQSSPWGNGVYRSVDGGRTWAHLGLEETHHIARIQVHPRDPDVAYVAAVGHLWGPNQDRGVFRTTDGGRTWEKVLYVDENTGVIDLAMDPGDPRTLFAATYQRRRRAWGFNGGGPGSGIWRTFDGGDSWSELTEGLPEGDKGRIGLDVFRRDGSLVCAVVEADAQVPGQGFGGGGGGGARKNGVYCSTDRGETWLQRSTTNNRPMYYSQIRIDPNDPERIYLGGSDLFRSSDGGRSFTNDAAEGVHLDHHALWIDPNDSDHLLLGSDGGLSVSWDRSDHWFQYRNLPVGQFYEIGVDMREPYHVCGGLQDNGSWCAPSDTWSNQGIRTRDWYNVGSGDGFFAVMHPNDETVMLAESQGGNVTRVNLVTNERARIRPEARPGADGATADLRWNWDTPVLLSRHDERTVYIGSNVLFRSRDMGQSWETISPDLTWAIDRDTLRLMGVPGGQPQMSRNDGQSSYGNLTAIAESPVEASLLYTGADDGRLQVTRDAGQTWTDITANVRGLPAHTYVTRIVASHGAAGTVFAAFDGHRSDDFAPYVFRSDDFGRTWRAIVSGLPATSVNALAQHPDRPDLLFLGNEVGVYVSIDGGGAWVRLHNGLPTVPVDDIVIHPRDNDLVLGTHGRGIWIMDDIGPLEELTPELLASAAHLFRTRQAVSYNEYTPQGWTPGIFAAPNPEAGARVRYWLRASSDSVALTLSDAMGSPVRALKGPGEAGLNEVIWDLRVEESDASGAAMGAGPRVLPGTYLVRIEAGVQVMEGEVTVRLDPRAVADDVMLAERQRSMLASYRLSGPADKAQESLDRVREQLRQVRTLLGDREGADGLRAEVGAMLALADSLDDDLGEAGAGAQTWRRIEGVTGPATSDQEWQIERSWEELPPVIGRINTLLTERMPALNARLNEAGIRPDPGPVVPLPRRSGG